MNVLKISRPLALSLSCFVAFSCTTQSLHSSWIKLGLSAATLAAGPVASKLSTRLSVDAVQYADYISMGSAASTGLILSQDNITGKVFAIAGLACFGVFMADRDMLGSAVKYSMIAGAAVVARLLWRLRRD
ncbi:hypothetical protein HOL34_02635 [bacterium]|jgi:hypothetical protein|nr:hypothetical protein [bacterium]MBT3903382.1 hypothetical protein [bacterium]MBT4577675.1 hypothetical protein [bacterium]MBT5345849.1 hypothetical protein [bacterium]MBT6130828.1 hypothetical protein [bacterium]